MALRIGIQNQEFLECEPRRRDGRTPAGSVVPGTDLDERALP